MRNRKYDGAGLTLDEIAVVQRYQAWVHAKRMATRWTPFYAEIDRQFPELDSETREELAESMFRKQLSDYSNRRIDRQK